jgi:hypothetical protein
MKDIGEKKLIAIGTIFGFSNFTTLNCFLFKMLKTKIWANFHRIIELFTQTIVSTLSKIWVWYPGSEIRVPEKPTQYKREPSRSPESRRDDDDFPSVSKLLPKDSVWNRALNM